MKYLISVAVAILVLGCERKTVKDPPPAPTEITSDTTVVVEPRSAQNSLAYLGAYKGVLKCANCPAGQTMLELSEEFNYILTVTDTNGKAREHKGTFSWSTSGDAVVLAGLQGLPNVFVVKDRQLMLQNEPTAILLKMRDAEAANTDAAPSDEVTLAGTSWQLAGFGGSPVANLNPKKRFLTFNRDATFGAAAGCNSIGGQYQTNGSKISFSKVMATRMACAEMESEQKLLSAFDDVDNFVVNKKILQLRRGGKILATFDAK